MEKPKTETKVEDAKSQKEGLFSRANLMHLKDAAVHKLKTVPPELAGKLKEHLANANNGYRNWYFEFAKYSLVKKLSFVGFIFFTVFSTMFLYKLATKGLIPHEEEMFISSLEDWSQEKQEYDPKTQMESFFESTRTSQNIFMIKKLVVNIRPSANSGPNPMGAFEFLAEGAANDVVVELKDREPEVQDLFSRTIEEMTYDQLASADGKKSLCDRLRKEVNAILTTGFVRRVFLKTALVKP